MMKQEHVLALVADYVLELLTPAERLWVEEHTAGCESCRRALQREKQMAQLISHSLHLATQPGHGRLPALMPAPPRARPPRRLLPSARLIGATWATQLAPLTLVLVLLVSTLWLSFSSPADPWRYAPGYLAATQTAAAATVTATVTSSATSPSTLTTVAPVATVSEGNGGETGGQTGAETDVSGTPETDINPPAATPVARVMVRNGVN